MRTGKWKVYSQFIGDGRKYIAGRQLDLDEVQHAGNMEYHGSYTTDREFVIALCTKLNAEELR